jgi:hypothetical protein
MASLTRGTTFVDGVANDVTAAKLSALVDNATPTSGFIQDRTAETITATNDTLLIGDASDSNNLKRITVANFAQTLPTAKVTTGTIDTGTFGTTTSTAATITTGTITTGVIPTLTSITKITSGTGTAAAPAISPTGDTNTGIFFPTADTVAFAEGGAEAMRIDSNGNVGVGTTSIAAKLHVYSATASDELVRFGPGGISDGNFITTAKNGVAGATDGTPQFSLGMDYSTTYTDLAAVKFARGSGAQGNILLFTGNAANGTERLRIDESGNVGIGTTSPSGKFEVRDGRAFFSAASEQYAIAARYISNGGPVYFGAASSSTAPNAVISNAAGTAIATFANDGNVGIGDTSPSAKLDVNGSFNATSGTIPTLVATTLLTTGTGTAAAPAIVPTGDTNTGIFFPAADTIAFSEGGAEAMRINSSGQVGIGMSPTTKLEVLAATNTGIRVTNGTMSGVFFNTSDTSIGIGTTTNHPVVLYSNNVERTRIDTSGNVSIGTATALSRLHVHGDLTMSNATVSTTAATGGLTPPATVAGYLTVSINGTSRKIPYYA